MRGAHLSADDSFRSGLDLVERAAHGGDKLARRPRRLGEIVRRACEIARDDPR